MLILSYVLLLNLFTWHETVANKAFYLKSKKESKNKVLTDMPTQDDLSKYVRALESITKFSNENVGQLDSEYLMSIFLANVQLERIAVKPKKYQSYLYTPKLKNIVKTNKETFKTHIEKSQSYPDDPSATSLANRLFASFEDSSEWASRLDDFNFDLLSRDDTTKHKDLLFEYPEWSEYIQTIKDYTNYTPTPLRSERCVTPLLRPTRLTESKYCEIPFSCKEMILTGNTYGFLMTRRFMYMLITHFGKKCLIFTPGKDNEMRKLLCAIMYVEASFIASNNFKLPELILEQMSLCALDGHAQFLRRSWLDQLLRYMESECSSRRYQYRSCDPRVKAHAAGALAGAIRYAVETVSPLREGEDISTGNGQDVATKDGLDGLSEGAQDGLSEDSGTVSSD